MRGLKKLCFFWNSSLIWTMTSLPLRPGRLISVMRRQAICWISYVVSNILLLKHVEMYSTTCCPSSNTSSLLVSPRLSVAFVIQSRFALELSTYMIRASSADCCDRLHSSITLRKATNYFMLLFVLLQKPISSVETFRLKEAPFKWTSPSFSLLKGT